MTESSFTPLEKARKAVGAVFQVLGSNGKQGQLATVLGMSDTSMSRLKNEQLESVVKVLYHAGFKVVPQDFKCIPEVQARAWFDSHQREVAKQAETNNLWTDE